MGTRACRNFRNGPAVVRFVGSGRIRISLGLWRLALGNALHLSAPGSVYCPCFVSVVSSPSGFEIFVYYLSGWPLRTYTARPRGACAVCGVARVFTIAHHKNSVYSPPGRAISFYPRDRV